MKQLTDVYVTENSKICFLKGCICIAQADGYIDESEKIFFISSAQVLNLDENNIKLIITMLDTSQNYRDVIFENRIQTLMFLRESMQLCYLDGSFSKSENDVIQAIAIQNDVKYEIVSRLEQWVLEGIRWRENGERLLYMEEY